MNKSTLSQVVIYHDETKDVPGRNFKGHALLFVPVHLISITDTPLFGPDAVEHYPQDEILQKITKIRQEFGCDWKLHFSEISGRKWTKCDFAFWHVVNLAIDGLRHKHQDYFSYPLHCKLAVMFYPKQTDLAIYGSDSRKERRLRHDETILRMLLKGAVHYLYDGKNPIEVDNIVSDGQPEHRELDNARIVWRLAFDDLYGKTPLREYVTFSPDASILHQPSDHKAHAPDSNEFKDANLLQITDLLLGAVIRSCYGGITETKILPRIGQECIKKDVIAQPVKRMLDKKMNRGGGFKNSGHYRSFTITQVEFSSDALYFREVNPVQIAVTDSDELQMHFSLMQDPV